jgi:hypothetical protein
LHQDVIKLRCLEKKYFNSPCFSSELRDKIRNSVASFSQWEVFFLISSFETGLRSKSWQVFVVLQVDIWLCFLVSPIGLFLLWRWAQRGPWSWGSWITHNHAPYSVGLLWTNDQHDAETYLTVRNNPKRQISMPSAGF